jgi:hypothetical protein
MDEGKLVIAHPPGWKGMGRSKDYIAGITKSNSGGPPQIIITRKDLPEQTLGSVTLDNFGDFLKLVEEQLAGELLEKEELLEPVRALLLGNRPYARYVRRVAFNIRGTKISGERQILRTLVNNKLYTIELQTLPAKLGETRNDAYSLAANIVIDGVGPETPAPMAEGEMPPATPPEGTPAPEAEK